MLDVNYNRRDFLRVGGLGVGLSVLPFSDGAFAQESFVAPNNKSVVWVWLGGGPTQFETFHAPTEVVPDPHKPVAGAVTHKNGLAFGGLFQELIKQGDNLTAVFGSNHPLNGMPAYVKQGKIEGEQPTFLGGAHKPFDPSNKDNLTPRIDVSRFSERKALLASLDRVEKVASQQAKSFSKIGDQAFNVILGNAKQAFDLEQEHEAMRDLYGKGGIGDQMLLARRLAQFGT